MPVPCQFHASSSARGHWGAFFASLALCLGVTSLSSQPAKASVTYCNETGQTIYVARGYHPYEGEDWLNPNVVTNGWYKINNGLCEILHTQIGAGYPYYYYAEFSGGNALPVFNTYHLHMCVKSGSVFNTTDHNSCTSKGYKNGRFRAFTNGYYDHTYYPIAKDTYRYRRHCTVTFTNQGYRDPIKCIGTVRVKAHRPVGSGTRGLSRGY